ncbi:unnamed protein product [Mycena citricolor]|uniref:Uncharacterized protein n=1 Tax=Mycena citricolor TaxID=2018698 RepID=A0AAD2Q333_9AGAR|nr:unnamed protein product [Mycena citricolor]
MIALSTYFTRKPVIVSSSQDVRELARLDTKIPEKNACGLVQRVRIPWLKLRTCKKSAAPRTGYRAVALPSGSGSFDLPPVRRQRRSQRRKSVVVPSVVLDFSSHSFESDDPFQARPQSLSSLSSGMPSPTARRRKMPHLSTYSALDTAPNRRHGIACFDVARVHAVLHDVLEDAETTHQWKEGEGRLLERVLLGQVTGGKDMYQRIKMVHRCDRVSAKPMGTAP